MSDSSEPAATGDPQLPRRRFFSALLAIGVAGVGVLLSVPVVRMVLSPVLERGGGFGWSDLGPVSDYENLTAPVSKAIQVTRTDGWRQAALPETVYVIRDGAGKLQVLSSICPHLGCAIGWEKSNDRFFCPCHNSIFTPLGKFVSGAARRGMDPLETSVEGGRLQVRFALFQPQLSRRVPMD